MKYELVCFDVDGTLFWDPVTKLNLWQMLFNDSPEGLAKNQEGMKLYRQGTITMQEWLDRNVAFFRKHKLGKDHFLSVAKRQKLIPGVKEAVHKLKELGLHLAVVSESLTFLVETQFPDHPFDEIHTHRALFDNDEQIEAITCSPYYEEKKWLGVQHIAERAGISLNKTVFVGDNYNDVTPLQKAGLGIAFLPKHDFVAAAANVVIEEPNMELILPHILQ